MSSDRQPDDSEVPPDAQQIPVHSLSVEEALDLGKRLHVSGDLARAGLIYVRILQADPDNAEALHFAGLLQHKRGEVDEALLLLDRSIEIEPERSGWRSNFGSVLFELGRTDDAIASFEAALSLDPANADAHNNLGVALRVVDRPKDAEDSYRRAIAADPRHHDAHDNLGRVLVASGRVREAIACYAKARELDPRNESTRRFLVAAYGAIGDRASAIEVLDEWLAEDPGHHIAIHLRAAMTGEDIPERASDAYVATLFDRFATSFDTQLTKLEYRAPALVAAAVERACGAPQGRLIVCDAGCGTGLCGPLLAPYKAQLTGVDLSDGMLAKARPRGCYDALVRAELTAFLATHPRCFDLVVSADTLCYFGALEEVLQAAAAALQEGGFLVFSVEAASEVPTFKLNLHGRYSHHPDYVRRTLEASGFTVLEIRSETLRKEAGEGVAGLLATARQGVEPRH